MKDDQEAQARTAVRRALKKMPWAFMKEGSHRFFRAALDVQDVCFLIDAAREGSADALDILREHARGARRAGMNVPDEFHAFVWEYFIDGPPKTPGGPKPQDLLLRDIVIVSLVKIVSEFVFHTHRNKLLHNKKTGPFSACAIVAQELGLGESNVEDVWNDGKANVGR